MAINLTINGVIYAFPETGEENWGDVVTSWASAVSTGLLQKSGGLFTLTAELDFGPTYGLKSAYYKSQAADVADAGVLRMGNAEVINWRNAADGGNLSLQPDSSDNLLFQGINLQPLTTRGDIIIRDSGGDNVRLGVGGVGEVLKSDGTDIAWGSLAGSGDVVGPGSATDNALARYDLTTGKLLQDSLAVLDDLGALTLGDGTGTGTTPDILIDKDSGDAMIRLMLNHAAATSWDIHAVNSDSDKLKFRFNTNTVFAFHTDGTIEAEGSDASTDFIINNTGTGDAGIALRVNDSSANQWTIYNDNSDSDQLKFAYNSALALTLNGPSADLQIEQGTAGNDASLSIVAPTDVDSDALIRLRVNGDVATYEWLIINDNTDDYLKLYFNNTKLFEFDTDGDLTLLGAGTNSTVLAIETPGAADAQLYFTVDRLSTDLYWRLSHDQSDGGFDFYYEGSSRARFLPGGGLQIINDDSSAPAINTLFKANIPKAWAHMDVSSSGSVSISNDHNVSSASWSGENLTVNWDTNFSSASYYTKANYSTISGGSNVHVNGQSLAVAAAVFEKGTCSTGNAATWVSGNDVEVTAIGDQ